MIFASVVSKCIVISNNCTQYCVVVLKKVKDIPHHEYSANFQFYWELLIFFFVLGVDSFTIVTADNGIL